MLQRTYGASHIDPMLLGGGVQGQPLAIGLHLSGIPAAVLNHVRQASHSRTAC